MLPSDSRIDGLVYMNCVFEIRTDCQTYTAIVTAHNDSPNLSGKKTEDAQLSKYEYTSILLCNTVIMILTRQIIIGTSCAPVI